MIRELVPDCSLTTDIIVGFPGETEADFADTLDVVEQVRYDSAFTFIYSPRRGTEAAALPDQVPHDAVSGWAAGGGVQRRATERAQRFVGRTMDVLVEGPSRTDRSSCAAARATTRRSTSRASPPGELADVEIASATSTTLAGDELLLARLG